MKVHGSCHCKATTYEAEVDPQAVAICHCTDCQSLTGSAYRVSVPVERKDFSLISGTPTVYVKLADSGARRAQVFCSNCGSPLYTYAVDNPQRYGLRVGCIAERSRLIPSKQIWCRSALRWTQNLEGIQASDRE
jgi:hypothetical protein